MFGQMLDWEIPGDVMLGQDITWASLLLNDWPKRGRSD